MPDSMNFANDPNAIPQQGMPMQGWDPNQYGNPMPDGAFPQGMYPQQDMQAQAMYNNQMGTGPMYPAYPDQMQQMYDPQAQFAQQNGMYYPDQSMVQPYENSAEAEAERMAQQAQMRTASMFGPKGMGSQGAQDMEYGAVMGSGMPMPASAPQSAQPMQPDFGMANQQPAAAPMGAVAEQPAVAPQQAVAQPTQQAAQPMQPAYVGEPPKKGKAIASLILGIFSIIFAIIPPIGILLGWLSTRLAKKYIKAGGTSAVGDSGRIFGRVGFVFSIAMFIILGFVLTYVAGASFGNYGARALAIFYNHSPLGQVLGLIPLA